MIFEELCLKVRGAMFELFGGAQRARAARRGKACARQVLKAARWQRAPPAESGGVRRGAQQVRSRRCRHACRQLDMEEMPVKGKAACASSSAQQHAEESERKKKKKMAGAGGARGLETAPVPPERRGERERCPAGTAEQQAMQMTESTWCLGKGG